jgi:hypothetical protein
MSLWGRHTLAASAAGMCVYMRVVHSILSSRAELLHHNVLMQAACTVHTAGVNHVQADRPALHPMPSFQLLVTLVIGIARAARVNLQQPHTKPHSTAVITLASNAIAYTRCHQLPH